MIEFKTIVFVHYIRNFIGSRTHRDRNHSHVLSGILAPIPFLNAHGFSMILNEIKEPQKPIQQG